MARCPHTCSRYQELSATRSFKASLLYLYHNSSLGFVALSTPFHGGLQEINGSHSLAGHRVCHPVVAQPLSKALWITSPKNAAVCLFQLLMLLLVKASSFILELLMT